MYCEIGIKNATALARSLLPAAMACGLATQPIHRSPTAPLGCAVEGMAQKKYRCHRAQWVIEHGPLPLPALRVAPLGVFLAPAAPPCTRCVAWGIYPGVIDTLPERVQNFQLGLFLDYKLFVVVYVSVTQRFPRSRRPAAAAEFHAACCETPTGL